MLGDDIIDRFILAPNIAAINAELAVAIQRDEHTRSRHFAGVVERWPDDEGIDGGFEFAQPCIHLFGQVIAAVILLGQRVELCHERVTCGFFGFGKRF